MRATVVPARAIPYLVGRVSLFIIYFWFGVLKLCDASPANPLVAALLRRTLPFMTFSTFIVLLGLAEMALGLLFLSGRWRMLALWLLGLHIVTTTMPLVLLGQVTWCGPFVPTLEGQYIIKNLALISVALFLVQEYEDPTLAGQTTPAPGDAAFSPAPAGVANSAAE